MARRILLRSGAISAGKKPFLSPDRVQLHEQKYYSGAYYPYVYWGKSPVDGYTLDTISSPIASLANGYQFYTFKREELNGKKIKTHWRQLNGVMTRSYLQIYDGEYDRSSLVDFPEPGTAPASKGDGLLQTLASHEFANFELTETLEVNIGGSLEYCTLFFKLSDLFDLASLSHEIWYVKVLSADEAEELFFMDFVNNIVMELTGTYHDYGYMLV